MAIVRMCMGKKKFVANNFSVDASGLHAENSERFVQSAKRQATSDKLQAASSKLNQNLVQVLKHQATSCKAASTGVKRQAASYKLSDPCTTVQEY